jgi:hypothetical protein
VPGWLVRVVHRRGPRAGDATPASLAERRAGGPCAPTWASSGTAVLADSASSIPPEATGRLDGEQFVEIEINDRLQCLTGGALAQRFGHCPEPSDIFRLQGEQFGDRCVPTLGPSTPPQRVSWARCSSTPSLALAIACLALGAGERMLALGWPASALAFRHVTVFQGGHAFTAMVVGTGVEIAGALRRPERRFSRSR